MLNGKERLRWHAAEYQLDILTGCFVRSKVRRILRAVPATLFGMDLGQSSSGCIPCEGAKARFLLGIDSLFRWNSSWHPVR